MSRSAAWQSFWRPTRTWAESAGKPEVTSQTWSAPVSGEKLGRTNGPWYSADKEKPAVSSGFFYAAREDSNL
jgi:hypothetical protein